MASRRIDRRTAQLPPEECSHRAAGIAVDMCVMNVQYMNTLSQFVSKKELFHIQMMLLYGLIDTMGATVDMDPQSVLDVCQNYFESLKRERNAFP